MDGLEISELMISEVLKDNESFRFDSEYFKKGYITVDNLIKNIGYLSFNNYIELLTDGKHGGVTFTKNGVIFLKNSNIKDGRIDLSDLNFISENESKETLRAEFKENDILVTTIGSVGLSVVVPPNFKRATINQNLVRIVLKDKTQAHFISTFLNCYYGKSQTIKMSAGNVYQMINYPNLKKIKIPNLTNNFRVNIEILVKSSYQKLEESKTIYKEAENILLKELDLLDFEPTKENISIKSFSESFGISGRIDSEYYLPKYIQYIEILKNYKYGWKLIQEVLTNDIKSGTTPKGIIKKYIPNSNYFFRAEAFNNDLTLTYENLYSMSNEVFENYPNITVKQNDILVSMTGTIGSVAVVTKKIDGIINQNIVKLSVNQEIINHNVLALYIKIIGKTLLTREQTGNVQPYVNISNFSNLIVPLIDKKIQTQIEDKIKESFILKEESKELLELAKRGVELAIEEGEDVAIEFIKEKK